MTRLIRAIVTCDNCGTSRAMVRATQNDDYQPPSWWSRELFYGVLDKYGMPLEGDFCSDLCRAYWLLGKFKPSSSNDGK